MKKPAVLTFALLLLAGCASGPVGSTDPPSPKHACTQVTQTITEDQLVNYTPSYTSLTPVTVTAPSGDVFTFLQVTDLLNTTPLEVYLQGPGSEGSHFVPPGKTMEIALPNVSQFGVTQTLDEWVPPPRDTVELLLTACSAVASGS